MKNQIIKKEKEQDFFFKLDNFPIKYALFINYNILDELNIEIGKKIYFEYLEKSKKGYNIKEKKIEIRKNRKVFTNKILDYICIELFESDGIYDYFQIEPDIFKYDNHFFNK